MARQPLAYIAELDHDRSRIYGRGNAVGNTGTTPWQLRDSERMIVGNAELLAQRHFLIEITRVRNEALILGDTLDFVGRHVDAIIAYDDASTDGTVELLRNYPKVAVIVANGAWETDIKAHRTAETPPPASPAMCPGAIAIRLDVLLRRG